MDRHGVAFASSPVIKYPSGSEFVPRGFGYRQIYGPNATGTTIELPPLISDTTTKAPIPIPQTYNLCISFTRDGLLKRVPWVFVLYLTHAQQGTRLRAKDITEPSIDPTKLNARDPAPPTGNHTYRFIARENAYVDNHSCHGRVILRVGMTRSERDEALKAIERTELSDIIGFRDCQKWCIECLRVMGFDKGVCGFWEGLKAKDVYVIEKAVGEREDMEFIRGPAYRLEAERKEALVWEGENQTWVEKGSSLTG